MLTLEQLLDGYRTYRDAFEVAMEQLQQADEERDELYEELCDAKEKCERLDKALGYSRKNCGELQIKCERLDEDNGVLVERLVVRDCENIKLAGRIRELEKELAKYRGEEAK